MVVGLNIGARAWGLSRPVLQSLSSWTLHIRLRHLRGKGCLYGVLSFYSFLVLIQLSLGSRNGSDSRGMSAGTLDGTR